METIATAVRMIEHGWPQRFTREQALMYLDGLSDLDGDDICRAVRALARVSEFRPTIAAVRQQVASENAPSAVEATQQAAQWLAWRDSRRFVNGSGYDPQQPAVHPSVVEACEGLRLEPRWVDKFLRAWRSGSIEMKELEGG